MTTPSVLPNALRILVVAPDDVVRARLRTALAGAGWPSVDEETDLDHGLTRSAAGGHDGVIVDHPAALDLVTALRGRGASVPVLLCAAAVDEALERAAQQAGVTDVLGPDDLIPTRLARRINAAVGPHRGRSPGPRDELLAIVSHDLRSPLNAIVLACDALETELGDTERKRYVAAVRRAGQRAERLLRDLLDVSRIETGGLKLEPRAVSARSILEQTRADHELLARDAGSQITLEVPADPGAVLADRDRVLQVLANLIGNSLKHAAGSEIKLEARGDADAVELVVADRGPGIHPDALPHIFDRFWQGRTRRRGGAGLGLTIARGIVEAHGGAIAVTSEPGQGTRFTVRLPRPTRSE